MHKALVSRLFVALTDCWESQISHVYFQLLGWLMPQPPAAVIIIPPLESMNPCLGGGADRICCLITACDHVWARDGHIVASITVAYSGVPVMFLVKNSEPACLELSFVSLASGLCGPNGLGSSFLVIRFIRVRISRIWWGPECRVLMVARQALASTASLTSFCMEVLSAPLKCRLGVH